MGCQNFFSALPHRLSFLFLIRTFAKQLEKNKNIMKKLFINLSFILALVCIPFAQIIGSAADKVDGCTAATGIRTAEHPPSNKKTIPSSCSWMPSAGTIRSFISPLSGQNGLGRSAGGDAPLLSGIHLPQPLYPGYGAGARPQRYSE